ncbi:MAG: tRNA (adenosine(37)-N6)-dimethylallyltransferase MiaA [bacterium]|nr:tRNA (adenosine(37)-N6)-dimethylallyltransferase MiaA [bacterium]
MTAVSNAANSAAPELLILAGTTASGKTDVSIPLAESLKGEILSADSRQIFRELEIGTAKPSPVQLARVRHHFINEMSVGERWTAGDFAREARSGIEEILARGHVPIVVGGSMLYLRALTDGFYEEELTGHADYRALRREWENGGEALYAELQMCDPDLAAHTAARDHHRILRGLWVFRRHGVRLSDLQDLPAKPIGRRFRLCFLHADRAQTYQRVNARVLRMIEDGLIEEVRALAAQGFDETNCNALRTHGYQEVFPYLRGEITRQQMIEAIQKAVRHYVKRQLTWFRRDPRAVWIERRFNESPEAVAGRIREDFLRS